MKLKPLALLALITAVSLVPVPKVWADDSQLLSLVQDLQKQMSNMQKTIDQQNSKIRQLETRPTSEGTVVAGAGTEPTPMSDYEFDQRLETSLGGANKWLKGLTAKGDLRLRYEGFHNHNGTSSETDDRNRFRYRLRYGFEKKFSDDLKAGFSLASGEASAGQNVDPTSTNTTFDNNFNFKDIFVEKAYASYDLPYLRDLGPLKKINLTGGKADNPFEKGSSDIMWDRDVKPEGLYEKANFSLLKNSDIDLSSYFVAGQYVMDEDAASGGDSNLYAYQLGINPVVYLPGMETPVDWLTALSFYDFDGYAVKNNFLIGTTSLARGNFNTDGSSTELDAQSFQVWDFYNEVGMNFFGIPFRPYYDVLVNAANQRVGDQDGHSWALGLKVGSIQKKGDWEAQWAYKYIGSEATPGFNDSDFGNAGHSGHRGAVVKLGYGLSDNVTLNSALFIVNNLNKGTSGILDEEQRRFQLDLIYKF